VDPARDHVLGNADAEITLVEYGSYACPYCRSAHEVVADLRHRFGDRMRYVFRQRPISHSEDADRAAGFAEYAALTGGHFWPVHDALMTRGTTVDPEVIVEVAGEFGVPAYVDADPALVTAAERRVQEDRESARRSGVHGTPTFFINGRRYEGAWDESALAEAMLGSLGHRLHSATLDFVRWAPSTGLLLLLATLLAVVLSNTSYGDAFVALWQTPVGVQFGDSGFSLSLVNWINDGLLSVFFLVVGLEIKREFTIGRLASRRAAALPIAASIGGMVVPALIYLATIPAGPLDHGWGLTIATDTAFAVALIVLLGERVPIELRVFLTAAVIVDDLVAIGVVALFYSDALHVDYLFAAGVVVAALMALNRAGVYRALPYAVLGVLLWICLHHGGVHATLSGVVLALVTPTRPPANLRALVEQAEMVMRTELANERGDDGVMRHGPSEPALHALDAIHDRIESPADKLLRTVEPWSSYAVLPLFAFANAGVTWVPGILDGHGPLMLAIVLGLVVGKPTGILAFAWLAVRSGLATKPAEYNWRQLAGAGALAGIGFTMSLFIAGQSFTGTDFAAAKVAIFAASVLAGLAGLAILWPRARTTATPEPGRATACAG
jgi:NhaA family Na+:H+ antiporter